MYVIYVEHVYVMYVTTVCVCAFCFRGFSTRERSKKFECCDGMEHPLTVPPIDVLKNFVRSSLVVYKSRRNST